MFSNIMRFGIIAKDVVADVEVIVFEVNLE